MTQKTELPTLTQTALTVLEKRYFLPGEDWLLLCNRVAKAVSDVEEYESRAEWADKFFDVVYNQEFLPNSPCLMNAGTELGQLSACFVLPAEEVIKQLDRASGSMFDLPAQLSKLMKGFLSETAKGYDAGDCPECKQGKLRYQEGCMCCSSCGFSKCS